MISTLKKFVGLYDDSTNGRIKFNCLNCNSHLNLDIYYTSSESAFIDDVNEIYLIVCKKCKIFEGINDTKKI